MEEERERGAALTRDLAAARQEIEARSVLAAAGSEATEIGQAGEAAERQLRQALAQERERGAALMRDLAAARQEIEARDALVAAAGSEAAEVRQAGEAAARQLQQALEAERERGVVLTRDLAAARREVEARSVLVAAAGSEAAEVRQAGAAAARQLQQAFEAERERGVVLTRDLAAARREVEARGVLVAAAGHEAAEIRQTDEAAARQLLQALEEERGRVAALTRDLAAARQEIEARTVLAAAAAGSEAAEIRQAGEAVARQLRQALEEERGRGVALTRDLAAARREIDARGVLAAAAGSEAAEVRQAGEAAARQCDKPWRRNASVVSR